MPTQGPPPKPFPRGEGGPRQRVGRGMRAENRKSVRHIRPTRRLAMRLNTGISLDIYKTRTLPPAFLFSHQSVPKSRLVTASPRGKRFGGNLQHFCFYSTSGDGFVLCHTVSICIVQEKSYHFPGNNAVGNTQSPRNNLAFGAIDVYNENDRPYGLLYFWR